MLCSLPTHTGQKSSTAIGNSSLDSLLCSGTATCTSTSSTWTVPSGCVSPNLTMHCSLHTTNSRILSPTTSSSEEAHLRAACQQQQEPSVSDPTPRTLTKSVNAGTSGAALPSHANTDTPAPLVGNTTKRKAAE